MCGIVKSGGNCKLHIYFHPPFSHPSPPQSQGYTPYLYFDGALCIREFWMTCCVLFHPGSFEGARTGCT